MEAAKAQLIAEIGPLDGVEIEVIPTLIVGPMGDFCGACWESGPCTVEVRWCGPLDGVEVEFDVTLHRGCVTEWVWRNASYVPEMTIELGLYGGVDVVLGEKTVNRGRPEVVGYPQDGVEIDPFELPPCELED